MEIECGRRSVSWAKVLVAQCIIFLKLVLGGCEYLGRFNRLGRLFVRGSFCRHFYWRLFYRFVICACGAFVMINSFGGFSEKSWEQNECRWCRFVGEILNTSGAVSRVYFCAHKGVPFDLVAEPCSQIHYGKQMCANMFMDSPKRALSDGGVPAQSTTIVKQDQSYVDVGKMKTLLVIWRDKCGR